MLALPPDQLGKSTVSGATETGGGIISTAFRMNGLGGGAGFLYTGDPFSNNLITMDYDGNLLTSVSGNFNPAGGCCNEDLTVSGGSLYHVYFDPSLVSGAIQTLDPATGNVLTSQVQNDTVGITDVAGTIWISHWNGMDVGTWDPVTDTFTHVFSTANRAGGWLTTQPVEYCGSVRRAVTCCLSTCLATHWAPASSHSGQ